MEDVARALFAHMLESHEVPGEWVLIKWLTSLGTVVYELIAAESLCEARMAVPVALVGDADLIDSYDSPAHMLALPSGEYETTLILEPAGDRASTPEPRAEAAHAKPQSASVVQPVLGAIPA